jgi:hypothetical protein
MIEETAFDVLCKQAIKELECKYLNRWLMFSFRKMIAIMEYLYSNDKVAQQSLLADLKFRMNQIKGEQDEDNKKGKGFHWH